MTGDLRYMDTPQEYLHDIWDYLIRAVDQFGDRLNEYPIIKTFAWITLLSWFLFRLLDRE